MENNRNIGPLVGGVVLVAFGLLALVGQAIPDFRFWNAFWPFIIVAFGAMFFVIMYSSDKSTAPLAIPGSIFTGIGLMMVIQNITNHWESWSYGWTVILMSVGVGIYLMGRWADNEQQREAGQRVFNIGLVLFVIFGAFFEMIFNSAPFAQYLFPLALIGLGSYLIVRRSGLFGTRLASEPAEIDEPAPKKSRKSK